MARHGTSVERESVNMADIRLGVDICFAKKRWPEPEAWMEIVTGRLGLKHVEFDSDYLDPFYVSEPARSEIAAEIKELAASFGVEIHNYFTGTMTHCINLMSDPDERIRKDGVRWGEEAIRLATQLGARGIGGHFDAISARNVADPERYDFYIKQMIRTMQHLSRIAAQEGHEFIMWEQMYAPCEVPYTLEQTEWIFAKANENAGVPIRLTLDTGHACCRNFPSTPDDRDPYVWLRRFAHMAPVIHIQQTDAVSSSHWPFTPEYNERGMIDGRKVIEAINETQAREVYLMLEVFFSLGQTDEEILDAMARSVEYWKQCLAT